MNGHGNEGPLRNILDGLGKLIQFSVYYPLALLALGCIAVFLTYAFS